MSLFIKMSNYSLLIWIICVWHSLLVTSHEHLHSSMVGNTMVGKELKEGNCDGNLVKDLVFEERIQKPAVPLMVRNATSSCHGDYLISCIMVSPQNEQVTPATLISIKEGGINHTFVTVEIHSKRNEGLDYLVKVFAKKL